MRPGKAKILAMILFLLFSLALSVIWLLLYFEITTKYGLGENPVLLGRMLCWIMAIGWLIPIFFFKIIKERIICKTERDQELFHLIYGKEKSTLIAFALIWMIFGCFFVK